MARVLALIPDLLFGSQVQGQLRAAGHEVSLVADAETAREQAAAHQLLVVDLTGELDGVSLVADMRAAGELPQTRTLAFYAHVDVRTRERALQGGFDLVVPRSRMAREGSELVRGLLGAAGESS